MYRCAPASSLTGKRIDSPDLTPMLVIKVLAVLVWIVWAHFLVCFLTEWRAFRAGRVPRPVPLGGGSQTVARQLVASILLLAGGASLAHGVATLGAEPEQTRPSAPVVQVVDQQVVIDALAGAQAAAEAAKDGGFMGIGAQQVSEREQAMLDQVRQAVVD